MLRKIVEQTKAQYYANLYDYIDSKIFARVKEINRALHSAAKHGKIKTTIMYVDSYNVKAHCFKSKVVWDYDVIAEFHNDMQKIVNKLNKKWSIHFPDTMLSYDHREYQIVANIC